MAARKKTMTSTIAGQVEMMKMVSAKLESPIKLDKDEAIYFDRIVKSRETASWSENHMVIAANLAMSYAQMEDLNLEIAERGAMVKNDRGTPVVNPAFNAKASLMGAILSMNRILGLSAAQTGVSGSDQDKRNQADARARDVIGKIANDELLA